MSGLIFTNEHCISCNKCVRVCTSPGASYVQSDSGSSVVQINPERCISCGACFATCEHNARDYLDDTDEFFRDLQRGEPISLLVAPSFRASYPDEYGAILGGLKALGVRRIISVAFGADICTWAYLKYIHENQFYGGISTPCPVVVSYIEHCLPELIPRMIPVQSPMTCAAIYCREELGITDRLAFIGPCIGKKLETGSESHVRYNVTFLKMMEYVRRNNVYGPDASDEIEYGLGSFYPAPGGLADNIRWFLGDEAPIRVVSGKTYLYGWLNKSARELAERNTPFLMIDALNCQEGCIEGTATESEQFEENRMVYSLQKIRAASKSGKTASPWNPRLSPGKRLARLNEQFKNLSLSHYLREFVNRSETCRLRIPSDEEADRIFNEMLKTTPESREINCSACGYNSCRDMMISIYNGFNTNQNCIHYEKNLALAKAEKARSANSAKTHFLSRMSHEIRTPISAIIGLDNIALRDANLSPHTRDELTKIGASSQHLLSIVNDILDMSRIESGKSVLKAEPFSMREFLEQICAIAEGQCGEKGLCFVFNPIEPLDEFFVGDSLKLMQILINILENSVKFTDAPGTVSLTAEQAEAPDNRALLRFTMNDTGIGMDRDYLPKLFESFSQEDTDNTSRYSGSGLGLAIAKSFVEMMGGEIAVDSEKGQGTTFTVSVPLERGQRPEAADAPAKEGKEEEKAGDVSLAGLHLLIAEDLEINAEILSELLVLEDMTSEWAKDGKSALEMFKQSKPGHFDAILMDMRMPVMDGLTATREIRKLPRPDAATIPIIALTANAFEEDAEQCLLAGMNVHMAKPADMELLKARLQKLIQ